jgi:L-lactate utilization protein LutC
MFRIPAFTGWGYSKDFPRFAARPFRARFKNIQLQPCHSEERSDKESPRTEHETLPYAQGDTDRVNQFTTELTALGGHVIPTDNPTRDIIEFLKARGINHVYLETNTLDESSLSLAGITTTSAPAPSIPVGVTPHVSLNWKEMCGVTKAICGLADTGSILIVDGEGESLHASLLPEVHIAVLKKSAILPSLENAMNLVRESKAAVFITGPSRTADIEMTLTIGVHGPGELHVFLVDG